MLPVFLDCPFLIVSRSSLSLSCVPNVASVSGLSCLCVVLCCVVFLIVSRSSLSLSCVPNVASVSGLSILDCI